MYELGIHIAFVFSDIDDLFDVQCELLNVAHNWKGV